MKRKSAVSAEIRKIHDQIIDVRRHLHQFPELSHQENETSTYISDILETNGIHVQRGIAGTGLLVTLGSDPSAKTIVFRCDLDALPVAEETGVPYASQCAGIMHACGHDVHTAIVSGTLLVLNKLKDELKGNIKFIFQPAEEALSGGAELIVSQGILDDVDAAFGIHVDPTIKLGKYGVKNDAMMASVDFIDIEVKGPGGHGARPHETVDTVFAASQVVGAIYQIQGCHFSSLESPMVVSICSFHGGTAPNVIPESCRLSGTFRTFAEEDRVRMRFLIEKVTKETCRIFGAECVITITPNAPPVINDSSLGHLVEKTIGDVFGEKAIEKLEFPMTASEDFAYYREKCPIYFLRIGVSSGIETSYPLHNSKFNVDERVIGSTVELMSHILLRYFD